MKTIIEGKQYRVFWRYDGDATECQIKAEDSEDVITFGIANRAHCDLFDRNIGRKLSLARALKGTSFDKAARAAFWDAYRVMTKEPRW